MTVNAITTWNKKRNANKSPKPKNLKKAPVKKSLFLDVKIRQEEVKTILENAGVKNPRDLTNVKDLYAVRAIQLGAVL